MTESSGKDLKTNCEENEGGSSAANARSSIDLEVVSAAAAAVSSNTGKNEIRVGEEGVAKLKFGFLDDMQGGDSSLEPGEVKTPPPGSSPAPAKESTPSRLAQKPPDTPAKILAKEALAKAMKAVSQMEAEACEEKVRAILELDAKRRKEETVKRKMEAEKKRQTGETDLEVEQKRLAKEERKKIKKIKKAKKAAKKALLTGEEDGEDKSATKTSQFVKTVESDESEGLCSSGPDDINENNSMAALSSAVAIPNMPMRYPSHLPPAHLPPDAFMGGFRPMNPFMRGPRPDFSHGRGGFMPRGRGILRGRMPFQGFRPPFFSGGGGNPSGIGGPPRHHTPYGPHHASHLGPSMQRHPHTPPPNRGHSPILPPSSDLQWTKCKPSLSYAFKVIKEHKFHVVQPELKLNPTSNTNKQMEENWDEDSTNDDGNDDDDGVDDDDGNQHKSHHHKRITRKKNKSLTKKDRKKAKKLKEKDTKKHKKSRSTSQTSLSMKKKKSNKSSRRKIEKIRKSYGTTNRTTPQQQQHSSEDTETTNENHPEEEEEDDDDEEEEDKQMEDIPNAEEIRNMVENIKREKLETKEYKIEDLTLKVKPLIIKIEPEEKDKIKDQEEQLKEADVDNDKPEFDMFADSPPVPPPTTTAKDSPIHPKEIEIESGSKTPPLPKLHKQNLTKSSLQNALEIQKRIDKLLQQDDIKLEAIEAAKEQLLKKTQKHQSAKDHHHSTKETFTPEREIIVKDIDIKKDNTSIIKNEEKIKEQPKAYKEVKAKHHSKERRDSSARREEEKDDKYISTKSKESEGRDSSIVKEKEKSKYKEKDKDKDKDNTSKDVTTTNYRNPFKRSLSRDRFFGRIDNRRRTSTISRERDLTSKRRLSNDRKRADSSGYSSSRLSSKRRFSGSSSASTAILNRSKSGERDVKGSFESISNKERDHKNRKKGSTPETKYKRKHSSSPKRKSEKDKEIPAKPTSTKDTNEKLELNVKSSTPPHPKIMKKNEKSQNKKKDSKKSKSPIIKRPLSFTQTEFLFPEEGNVDDILLNEDEETNDSFILHKSPSDKEDSPDTDDYMDNWENDEDVDLDINSNTPGDSSTPTRSSPDLAEEDSFVTRFANPSPPSELLKQQSQVEEKDKEQFLSALTPPLNLLKNLPLTLKYKEKLAESTSKVQSNDNLIDNKTELFGMQELYDQFIKSVEASGVNMQTTSTETTPKDSEEMSETEKVTDEHSETLKRTDDPLSTSSTSTSSTNSSASSSSDTNSSSSTSSSSSSASSSDDSNDVERFRKSKNPPKKPKLDEQTTTSSVKNENKQLIEVEKISDTPPLTPPHPIVKEREPRTPSPIPLQKSLLITQTTPITPSSQTKQPKSDVAKDFKKLKSLEANLSRIQMMRANYDSNDEISEELHKMEMLFLQEKKLILQKYAKNSQTDKSSLATTVTTPSKVGSSLEFLPALPTSDMKSPLPPPPPPPEEPNKIFDANREAIKLTISPMKLPSKPAIFNTSITEELDRRSKCVVEDKDEMDFTEKLVKPAKEVAIVKPMMETKESKESRSRDSQRQRRSPAYGSRDRPRSPGNYRSDRNRRSTSRTRFSPQRRGRGRSLSASPPRRAGNLRHGTPPRRGAPGARFRVSNRRSRSRSRSRSPLRQFGNRRGPKDGSPFRRKRTGVQQQDTQLHYKKFARHRGSRSRSPQGRPRSPRTPPPRRRSYSQDRYSRSPLPFKPPSPPMRRSLSPMGSPNSQARRSRSPPSPRRLRSPRSPRSPHSPRAPRSPRSPLSPPPCNRYDDLRHRRENSFERNSSISPHAQYYPHDAITSGVAAQTSSYYYNGSPNRISLDARINIVLNGPAGGAETPPTGFEGYTNYAQYGGAAYMSIPPQPIADPNSVGYYQNPYVAMIPTAHEGHPHHHHQHHSLPPLPHAMHSPSLPPHLSPHPPTYSNIPTINSGISGPASPANNFYYNDFNMGHHPANPVLKEIPKASTSMAVQKGNVLEIVPSNLDTATHQPKVKATTALTDSIIKTQIDKVSSISWKDEVNIRHVKAAVMRLNREGDSIMRSILKRSDIPEKTDKSEKKKVYFEDGIYPSRDSEDEDRQLVETRIRRKVIRLRRKRGIEIPAARDLIGERHTNKRKPKLDAALDKLPPPPPPGFAPAATLEQPIYLKPPTPVPLVYFHFDSVVHSMYVSQLEKPIPPRLLNPKCLPPGAATNTQGGVGNPTQSPNVNSPTGPSGNGGVASTKKDLSTLAALKRVSRNDSLATNSPKMIGESLGTKRESPNLHQPALMSKNKAGNMHFAGSQTSPQMSPIHAPPIRHPSSPLGFVGMRINNFMRLPPSPLARAAGPSHLQPMPSNMGNLPPHPSMMGGGGGMIRHPQYNMPPPNIMPPGLSPDPKYTAATTSPAYSTIQIPPPGYNFNHRPMNPNYFMGSPTSHTNHPPPPLPTNPHCSHKGLQKDSDHVHYHHQRHQHKPHLPPPPVGNMVAASPQAMIAPFNVNKTVN